jgi:hypothetical protein
MNIDTIIGGIIESQHGWAVRDQFIDTWNGEDFGKQNYNALRYIKDTIKELIRRDIFSEEVEAELVGYLLDLDEYLASEE